MKSHLVVLGVLLAAVVFAVFAAPQLGKWDEERITEVKRQRLGEWLEGSEDVVNTLSYHRDKRTNLCFAVVTKSYGGDRSITNVPCVMTKDVMYDVPGDALN